MSSFSIYNSLLSMRIMKTPRYFSIALILSLGITTFAWLSPEAMMPTRRSLTTIEMGLPLSRQEQKDYKIITCSSSNELADAISGYVMDTDIVAELGSQLREVSTQICETCKAAVLVDIIRKFPKTVVGGQKRTHAMRLNNTTPFYPDKATFIEIPSLECWRQAFFEGCAQDTGYDVLILDVNAIVGNDLEWTSLSLVQQFEFQNQIARKQSTRLNVKPLLVLVKSMGLNQWASRLVHARKWKGQPDVASSTHIVAAVGVHEYRGTIPCTVQTDDAVLEVGCHLGTTTSIIESRAAYSIGVDIGPKIIREAQDRHPEVFFRVGNAWKTAGLLRIQQEYFTGARIKAEKERKIGFDVVYVDVGGLSGSDGLLEAISLVSSLWHALEPRCIVIKSLCMQRLSSKLIPYWKSQKDYQHRMRND